MRVTLLADLTYQSKASVYDELANKTQQSAILKIGSFASLFASLSSHLPITSNKGKHMVGKYVQKKERNIFKSFKSLSLSLLGYILPAVF